MFNVREFTAKAQTIEKEEGYIWAPDLPFSLLEHRLFNLTFLFWKVMENLPTSQVVVGLNEVMHVMSLEQYLTHS